MLAGPQELLTVAHLRPLIRVLSWFAQHSTFNVHNVHSTFNYSRLVVNQPQAQVMQPTACSITPSWTAVQAGYYGLRIKTYICC
jgi:hypothetical protein